MYVLDEHYLRLMHKQETRHWVLEKSEITNLTKEYLLKKKTSNS